MHHPLRSSESEGDPNGDQHMSIADKTSQSPMLDSIPKQTNVLRLHSMDADDVKANDKKDDSRVHERHNHSSSHMMNHMDPSAIVFFLVDDLKFGKKLPIFFPDRALPSPSSPHSFTKKEADSIPFSLRQLPDLLQSFSFSQGSPQAIAMENTLRECETKPIKGEIKFCATSHESMLNFATEILGSETNIKLISTVHLTRPTNGIQEYTIIQDPLSVLAPKAVACHTMPYPYTIFYCHYQKSENRVYKVSLKGENGDRVEALAVCHMETSQWTPNHIAFRVLGIGPGSSPVCHFFPEDHFVLVSLPSTSSI